MCEICKELENKQYSEEEIKIIKERKKNFTSEQYQYHEREWDSYGSCWINYKKWNDKQKIDKIKQGLTLTQITQGNCALCAVGCEWINEGIFFRNWSSDDVKKELEDMGYPMIVTDKDICSHKTKHLSVKSKTVKYDDKKHIKAIQKDIKIRNELNTLGLKDHIDSQVLTLSLDIRELEVNDLTATSEYKTKIEMLKSFIDLKIKTEGGEVQDVNIINFWDKLKEKGGGL